MLPSSSKERGRLNFVGAKFLYEIVHQSMPIQFIFLGFFELVLLLQLLVVCLLQLAVLEVLVEGSKVEKIKLLVLKPLHKLLLEICFEDGVLGLSTI